MKKIKSSLFILLSFVSFILSNCGPSTILTRTWTDPSVSGSTFKPFKKVLVVARINDETTNRIAEDKLVAQFKSGIATTAYSFLRPGDTLQNFVDEKLRKEGFDGLVLMRLVNVNTDVRVQNTGGYGGYYGNRYGNTEVSVDKNYMVETSIFSLESRKMLWSGTTSSLNPGNLEKTLDEILAADRAQLIKQGLIKQ